MSDDGGSIEDYKKRAALRSDVEHQRKCAMRYADERDLARAELERLHEDVTGEHLRAEAYAAVAKQACAETDVYREAVAEVRAILARESEPWSHKLRDMHVVLDRVKGVEAVRMISADMLADILDRLPRGAT